MSYSLEHLLGRLPGRGRHSSAAMMAIAGVCIAAVAAAAAATLTAMALGGRSAHAYQTAPVVAVQAQVRDAVAVPPWLADASLPGASEVLKTVPVDAGEAAATF